MNQVTNSLYTNGAVSPLSTPDNAVTAAPAKISFWQKLHNFAARFFRAIFCWGKHPLRDVKKTIRAQVKISGAVEPKDSKIKNAYPLKMDLPPKAKSYDATGAPSLFTNDKGVIKSTEAAKPTLDPKIQEFVDYIDEALDNGVDAVYEEMVWVDEIISYLDLSTKPAIVILKEFVDECAPFVHEAATKLQEELKKKLEELDAGGNGAIDKSLIDQFKQQLQIARDKNEEVKNLLTNKIVQIAEKVRNGSSDDIPAKLRNTLIKPIVHKAGRIITQRLAYLLENLPTSHTVDNVFQTVLSHTNAVQKAREVVDNEIKNGGPLSLSDAAYQEKIAEKFVDSKVTGDICHPVVKEAFENLNHDKRDAEDKYIDNMAIRMPKMLLPGSDSTNGFQLIVQQLFTDKEMALLRQVIIDIIQQHIDPAFQGDKIPQLPPYSKAFVEPFVATVLESYLKKKICQTMKKSIEQIVKPEKMREFFGYNVIPIIKELSAIEIIKSQMTDDHGEPIEPLPNLFHRLVMATDEDVKKEIHAELDHFFLDKVRPKLENYRKSFNNDDSEFNKQLLSYIRSIILEIQAKIKELPQPINNLEAVKQVTRSYFFFSDLDAITLIQNALKTTRGKALPELVAYWQRWINAPQEQVAEIKKEIATFIYKMAERSFKAQYANGGALSEGQVRTFNFNVETVVEGMHDLLEASPNKKETVDTILQQYLHDNNEDKLATYKQLFSNVFFKAGGFGDENRQQQLATWGINNLQIDDEIAEIIYDFIRKYRHTPQLLELVLQTAKKKFLKKEQLKELIRQLTTPEEKEREIQSAKEQQQKAEEQFENELRDCARIIYDFGIMKLQKNGITAGDSASFFKKGAYMIANVFIQSAALQPIAKNCLDVNPEMIERVAKNNFKNFFGNELLNENLVLKIFDIVINDMEAAAKKIAQNPQPFNSCAIS